NTGGTNGAVTGGTVQIGDALTPATQTFQINSSIAIPNLVVSNGVAVTAQTITNPLSINNNITINAGTLNSNSLNITLGGNWSNNANFTAGTGTVIFSGSTAQTIGGSNATSFNNLTINNTTALVTLTNNVTINAILSFASGKISIDNYNLTIGTSGSITGASTNNYAIAVGSGTFIQQVTNGGSKTFPVGTITAYIPAIVTLTAGSTTDNFSVSVLPLVYTHGVTGSVVSAGSVNATWLITEGTAGGSNGTVALQWPASLELSGFNRSLSRLAHYTGGSWDYGASDIAASGSNPYTVVRTGFNSFSPFAVSMVNVLPVAWLNIKGFHKWGNNYIEWATASEQNNQYFEVEYAENGLNFSEAGRVVATGNSNNIRHYSFIHTNIITPILYYRIKQVDIDERFSYSRIIQVSSKTNMVSQVTIAPNPTSNFANITVYVDKASILSLSITDNSGRVIYSANKNVLSGNNNITIDLSGQGSGIYQLKLNDGNGNESVTRFIKN
ncbi:MAG TPA: T9SS type A sorting domain-containing protein, partial [Chitinophagaceae bacterium]|nr:T9SS type A sorting domain-containing protein [Chitinophagaceae bacterium]